MKHAGFRLRAAGVTATGIVAIAACAAGEIPGAARKPMAEAARAARSMCCIPPPFPWGVPAYCARRPAGAIVWLESLSG